MVDIQNQKIINVLNSNQNFKNLSNEIKKKYFERYDRIFKIIIELKFQMSLIWYR